MLSPSSAENTGGPDFSRLRLGTCSWSTTDWLGKVYTPGTAQVEFIGQYAKRYSTVEVDSTFYGTPRRSTVEGWRDRTPKEFLFSAKAPRIITHDKFLDDCGQDLVDFLDTMSILEERLGPIVFQFPYYAKRRNVTVENFIERFEAFAACLPRNDFTFVVEVRNKTWYTPRFLDFLRQRGIVLALIDHPWMPRPGQLLRGPDLVTGTFAYIRWLGDRHGIEKITTTWNETVVDRRNDLTAWTPMVKGLLGRQLDVYGYFNSHYSGYAPGDIDLLKELLGIDGGGPISR